ncbi:NACHT domain-containing protein [Flexivirga alba]|uniref:NACHT domain-containing protein n=1 Tax=Flexivirga alba TaxID=702742 RepID=A0ABW2AHI1_9MICO
MPADYPLEELGFRTFEQLCVAQCISVLGNGVNAFGAGPDGGREATFTGRVEWGNTAGFDGQLWDGYVVVQAKFRERNAEPASNMRWLASRISEELDKWDDDRSQSRYPEYLIVYTNVTLSGNAGTGGIDRIEELIAKRNSGRAKQRKPCLRGWKVWHRDQIIGQLNANPGIRQAFTPLLTVGDLLHRLQSQTWLTSPDVTHEVLTEHARSTLPVERWVNFTESGGNNRASVEDLIIDLPLHTEPGSAMALGFIVDAAELVRRPSIHGQPPHLVVTGAAGSGKSTLTRFLGQMYRAGFLDLSPSRHTKPTSELASKTREASQRLGLADIRLFRWPFRVDLPEYADRVGHTGNLSFLRFITSKMNERADVDAQPGALRSWFTHWPVLLLLDGLDEVTAPEVRARVIQEIETFGHEMAADDADLLMVVTTRPTGYTERLDDELFAQVDLELLSPEQAAEYGDHATSLRLQDDPDLRDRLLRSFGTALQAESTAALIRTPLQVLLVTFILERRGSLPTDRYELFWRYYESMYERESAKGTHLSALLRTRRDVITTLHERVGLVLQASSETTQGSRALLPRAALVDLAQDRLREVGVDDVREVQRVAQQIEQVATQRLVLLRADESETVGFDVRSLQEMMAARALTAGSDDQTIEVLQLLSASPHWRNTVTFCVGRWFTESTDHRKDLVTNTMRIWDTGSWPGWLCPIAPELAADLLNDGLSASEPRWQEPLVELALRGLEGPVPRDLGSLSAALLSVQGRLQARVKTTFQAAFAGPPERTAIAQLLAQQDDKFAEWRRTRPGIATADQRHPQEEPTNTGSMGQFLRSVGSPADYDLDATAAWLVEAALDELEALTVPATTKAAIPKPPNREWPAVQAALDNMDARAALELLIDAGTAIHWPVRSQVAWALWPQLTRHPVLDHLADVYPYLVQSLSASAATR